MRKLDAMVAEKVMGWSPHIYGNWPWQMQPPDKPVRDGIEQVQNVPEYSTDIAAAMPILDGTIYWNLQRWIQGGYGCSLMIEGNPQTFCGLAETASLAICKAILCAVGVPESDIQATIEGDKHECSE